MNIFPHFFCPCLVAIYDISANCFDFSVWFLCYFINKISNSKFGIFRYDISNVSASDKLDLIDTFNDSILRCLCNETFAHTFFRGLFE